MDYRKLIKRWGWPVLCLSLAIGWGITVWTNGNLRERVRLLDRVVMVQEQWCDGLGKVNEVCEKTLVDMAMRLGLDDELMPLVTTALWNRSMPYVPVRKALQKLGATRKSLPDPKAALGGPLESDERTIKSGKRGKR